MKKICSMIRSISGKPAPLSTSHLKVNGVYVETPVEIANSIASTISYNSSSGHYSERFRRFKAHQERRPVDFSSNISEAYNIPSPNYIVLSRRPMIHLLVRITSTIRCWNIYLTLHSKHSLKYSIQYGSVEYFQLHGLKQLLFQYQNPVKIILTRATTDQ